MHALRCSLLAITCAVAAATARAEPTGFPTTEPIRFIAFGDGGTGEAPQYAVARAMVEVCRQRGCQFATCAGDNIYQ